MKPHHRRRITRDLARAAAFVSAAMLTVSLAHTGADFVSAAATGSLTIVKGANPGAGGLLQTGGTATVFALQSPAGAACTGDGTAGYRIQTFIVSSSQNIDTMAWGADGPAPTVLNGPVRISLFSAGNPVVNLNPGLTTGALTNIPPFDFSGDGLNSAAFPAGNYTMGLACTRDTASGKVLDKYWSVGISITAAPTDLPNGFTWALATTPPPVATTTTVATTTATTVPGGVTTTTVAGGGTTSTVASESTFATDTTDLTDTTLVESGAVGGDGGGGVLVTTGSSPVPVAMWGFLLLVFGRMAVLLARPVRVIGPNES